MYVNNLVSHTCHRPLLFWGAGTVLQTIHIILLLSLRCFDFNKFLVSFKKRKNRERQSKRTHIWHNDENILPILPVNEGVAACRPYTHDLERERLTHRKDEMLKWSPSFLSKWLYNCEMILLYFEFIVLQSYCTKILLN